MGDAIYRRALAADLDRAAAGLIDSGTGPSPLTSVLRKAADELRIAAREVSELTAVDVANVNALHSLPGIDAEVVAHADHLATRVHNVECRYCTNSKGITS